MALEIKTVKILFVCREPFFSVLVSLRIYAHCLNASKRLIVHAHTRTLCTVRPEKERQTHSHTYQIANAEQNGREVTAWLQTWWESIKWLVGASVCGWVIMTVCASDLGSSYSLLSTPAVMSGTPRVRCRWQDRLCTEALKLLKSKQLAVTQACRKTLSRVIIDDSDQTLEGSCHGRHQAAASRRFSQSAGQRDFFKLEKYRRCSTLDVDKCIIATLLKLEQLLKHSVTVHFCENSKFEM